MDFQTRMSEDLNRRLLKKESKLLKKSMGSPRIIQKVYKSELNQWLARGWVIDHYQPTSYGAPQKFIIGIEASVIRERLS